MRITLPHYPVVLRAPGYGLRASSVFQRPVFALNPNHVPSDKPPARVGFIELLAGGQVRVTFPAVHSLVKNAFDLLVGVPHEASPHHPRGVRETMWKELRLRIQ